MYPTPENLAELRRAPGVSVETDAPGALSLLACLQMVSRLGMPINDQIIGIAHVIQAQLEESCPSLEKAMREGWGHRDG